MGQTSSACGVMFDACSSSAFCYTCNFIFSTVSNVYLQRLFLAIFLMLGSYVCYKIIITLVERETLLLRIMRIIRILETVWNLDLI